MKCLVAVGALAALGSCDALLGLDHQPPLPDALPDAFPACGGDNFDSQTIDRTRWRAFNDPGSAVAQGAGQLDIALPANTMTAYAGIETLSPLGVPMTTQVQLVQPATGPSSEAIFQWSYSNGNRVLFAQGNGSIEVEVNTTPLTARAFDEARDHFLRIEVVGSGLVLSTSPDDSVWTTLATTPAPADPPSVKILAGVYAPVTAPLQVSFDNFEIVTPDCQP